MLKINNKQKLKMEIEKKKKKPFEAFIKNFENFNLCSNNFFVLLTFS